MKLSELNSTTRALITLAKRLKNQVPASIYPQGQHMARTGDAFFKSAQAMALVNEKMAGCMAVAAAAYYLDTSSKMELSEDWPTVRVSLVCIYGGTFEIRKTGKMTLESPSPIYALFQYLAHIGLELTEKSQELVETLYLTQDMVIVK